MSVKNRFHDLSRKWSACRARDFLLPVALLIAGICFLCFPANAMSVLTIIVGVLMLVYAVLRMVFLLSLPGRGGTFLFLFLTDCLYFALGILLITNPWGALRFAAVAFGILLCVDGIGDLLRLYYNPLRNAFWWLCMAGGLLNCALGIVLLSFPAESTAALSIVLGIALIYEACARFSLTVFFHRLHRAVRNLGNSRVRGDYIEADFEDKSDT